MKIQPISQPFEVEFDKVSSDKSISHRCAIFSLLSDQTSEIYDYLTAQDTLNSLKIISQLGAKVQRDNDFVKITPPKQIISPNFILDCGNSGTAMRIFMGLLAANDGFFVLSGDEYLNQRPMRRISEPLQKIGAEIYGRDNANKAPIAICGKKLKYFKFDSPIASAQVKTAMILAGLLGSGGKFSEPELSRNHSEIMLKKMGANITANDLNLDIKPLKNPLKPIKMRVPNDPSSCFFFAVAAAITKGAKITLKNVLLNKTRIEAFKILEQMGAKISYKITDESFESMGEIYIEGNELKAVNVSQNISWLIDEAPALAIAFACAKGTSTLKNAKELRVKESDRIAVMVEGLQKCGINAKELEDGFEITGGEPKFATIDSFGDHRIAMSFAILGLKCGMDIQKSEFIATSFPKFTHFLKQLGAAIED